MGFRRRLIICKLFVFCLVTSFGLAQTPDVFRLEYMLMPRNGAGAKLSRIKLVANMPIKVRDSNNIVIGAEYNRLTYDLQSDEITIGEAEGLNYLHVIDLNLGYTFKLNKNWRAGIQFNPRIASTLTQSLTSDDYFINGGVFFINNRKKDTNLEHPFILVLGLTYNATTGLPFPLPFISYNREINESWSYNAGIPK